VGGWRRKEVSKEKRKGRKGRGKEERRKDLTSGEDACQAKGQVFQEYEGSSMISSKKKTYETQRMIGDGREDWE